MVFQLACKQAKSDLDKKFGGPWHAVAGEGFGHCVTYEAQHLCCESHLSLRSLFGFPPVSAELTRRGALTVFFFGGTGRRLAMLVYKSCQV